MLRRHHPQARLWSVRTFAATFLGSCWLRGTPSAKAETIDLSGTDIPEAWSLEVLYYYYVYSYNEAVVKREQPYIDFTDVTITSEDPDLDAHRSIQLSFVEYSDMLAVPQDFCCTISDVVDGTCDTKDQIRFHSKTTTKLAAEKDVYKYEVPLERNKPVVPTNSSRRTLPDTGVYVLVLSNCGLHNFFKTNVQGKLVVKNPFGFLPGIDFPKMPFYASLAILYIALLVVWVLLCIRYRQELFNIQYCITAVILAGLIESSLWFIFYYSWNIAAVSIFPLFCVAVLVSTGKAVFSYMLVLVGSMGWGVTKPSLGKCTIALIVGVSLAFIGLDTTRRVVTHYRTSRDLSLVFVFGVLMPMSCLNGIIFYWVFSSLGSTLEKLHEERQTNKMQLFKRLRLVLVFALIIAVASESHEFFNFSISIEELWKMHWFYVDGISHLLFVFVLLAMMVLWRPHENSKLYAYSAQLEDVDLDLDKENEIRPAVIGRL